MASPPKPKSAELPRLLILILTYNAQQHIQSVLSRIPEAVLKEKERYQADIVVLDDASHDDTTGKVTAFMEHHGRPVYLLKNLQNQGYGGNQKIGYHYAIEEGYDAVLMLHGDGQYAPEEMERLFLPLIENKADAVFGSRMLCKEDALKGGMPRYKYWGNRILTHLQNWLMRAELSEFHSGYRAYRTDALRHLPFIYNSNDFDFDTDIIIQLLDQDQRIIEVPIPTHYGEETCHVNGVKYALQILRSTMLSRIQRYGIYYSPKFDYEPGIIRYTPKLTFPSSHFFAMKHIPDGSIVLDIGCHCPKLAEFLRDEKSCTVHGLADFTHPDAAALNNSYSRLEIVNMDSTDLPTHHFLKQDYDVILLLDILEKREHPEQWMKHLRHAVSNYPSFILTVGNIAFLPVRLSFLLGAFNYGKRGILGFGHKRLFTFYTLRRLLKAEKYDIITEAGIPVPWPLVFRQQFLSSLLLKIQQFFIRLRRTLFAFQIGMVITRAPTLAERLEEAKKS